MERVSEKEGILVKELAWDKEAKISFRSIFIFWQKAILDFW